jgi:hypothetical protein
VGPQEVPQGVQQEEDNIACCPADKGQLVREFLTSGHRSVPTVC